MTFTKIQEIDRAPAGRVESRNLVLELHDVYKYFGNITALNHLDFAITNGEMFSILGPSGCGKSTALRLVAGLEQPDAGEIRIKNRLIASSQDSVFLPPEQRNTGMVFQSYAIWPHMTVFENIAFPLRLRRWEKNRIRLRVLEMLEVVGLEGLQDRSSTCLSGGQQQRVALARALSYSPEILLLDEPLSHLDLKLRERMRIELRAIQRRLGLTVLLVTHDQVEAMTISDRIAVMNAGHIEQVGTPVEIYDNPATPFVRDFIGRVLVFEAVVRGPIGMVELIGIGSEAFLTCIPEEIVKYPIGTVLSVSCRPETVAIEREVRRAPNRLRAVVVEVFYLGERTEYRVRTIGGRVFIVSGQHNDNYSPGTAVDVVIDPKRVKFWPKAHP